jgi:hypothetical protein
MAQFRPGFIIATLLVLVNANGFGQFSPGTASSAVAGTSSATAGPPGLSNATDRYAFPNGKQQFRNYLYNAFGPPALISTAIGAGLDQNKPAPPEWDSGGEGYGERYGWRFGMSLVSETTRYSLGAVTHEDVAYHRCACSGLIPRTTHAMVSTLSARTRSGRTIFSVPALVSPYAGSFTAMNAWYPSRYEPADAFRVGSISFAFRAAGNLVGEFIAPRR